MPVTIKYYPEDDGNDFGTLGIKLPMNSGGSSSSNGGIFDMSYTTEEQAVSNYVNLLLTKPGERYMQPRYGIGIQLQLFEQNTQGLRNDIELEIRHQCQIWLPYIINRSISVTGGDDGTEIPSLSGDSEYGINIVINFSVTKHGANRTITIFNLDGITNFTIG